MKRSNISKNMPRSENDAAVWISTKSTPSWRIKAKATRKNGKRYKANPAYQKNVIQPLQEKNYKLPPHMLAGAQPAAAAQPDQRAKGFSAPSGR